MSAAVEKGITIALDAAHQAQFAPPARDRWTPGPDLAAWLLAREGLRVRVWVGLTQINGPASFVGNQSLEVGVPGESFSIIPLGDITEVEVMP